MESPVKVWRNQKKVTSAIGTEGAIESWTVVRVPTTAFSDVAPYPVVLVRLADGTCMASQLVDWQPEHLHKGQKVKLVVRRVTRPSIDGVIPYGIKAKPIKNGGENYG